MINTILKVTIGFLVGLSFTIHAYEPPENLEARLAVLSNMELLQQRCGNVVVEKITEKQLRCMERQNPIVIAKLQLDADRAEIKLRLKALGANMKNKHKTFSGLGREMRKCGFTGNHAVRAWRWYKNGNKSHLACLEAKHLDVLFEDNEKELAKQAKRAIKQAMKNVDCSKESGRIRKMCDAIQALLN